ncbi:hypothetical protein PX52LOC_06893 [Limnoglobus roseus]|uniref:Uncharacterized protein n=1 Tax=Limnoglobus roseus TaxID=2598579 RepID=A0A5C1ANV1_9BACT|nr:hypothetical protein PX52LOC_06893 [Limnoglobus roseus]
MGRMSISLDRVTLEAPCPRCGFYSKFTFRQVRLNDVVICGGCKCNVQLVDHYDQCRKAQASLNRGIRELETTLSRLGKR